MKTKIFNADLQHAIGCLLYELGFIGTQNWSFFDALFLFFCIKEQIFICVTLTLILNYFYRKNTLNFVFGTLFSGRQKPLLLFTS
jgi:hypothetical protein